MLRTLYVGVCARTILSEFEPRPAPVPVTIWEVSESRATTERIDFKCRLSSCLPGAKHFP